jgi:hypothetical protein
MLYNMLVLDRLGTVAVHIANRYRSCTIIFPLLRGVLIPISVNMNNYNDIQGGGFLTPAT